VSQPNALDMGSWHTCETTHCRAGWVVALAGDEGKALEGFYGTPLAAIKIYRASSDLPVAWALRFFETDEEAMEDMNHMAELEVEGGEK